MILYGNDYNNNQYGTDFSDTMYGYGGNDYQFSYGGNDYLYGGSGNDYLSGGNGDDYVSGSVGSDYVIGGYGWDIIVGGSGADILAGASGPDTLAGGFDDGRDDFRFVQGDSPSYNGYADTIYDWNVSYDYIDMPIAGSYYNYAETSTGATSISSARTQVESSSTLRQEDHVFLYNSSTDTGYLLSDLDRNYSFETGVVIRSAGSHSDLNYWDII